MRMAVKRTASRGTARTTGSHARASSLQPGINMGERPLSRAGAGSRNIPGTTPAFPPQEPPYLHGQRRGARGNGRCTSRLHEVRRIDGQRTYPYTQSSANAQSLSCFPRATQVPWAAFPRPLPRFSCCVIRLWEMVGGRTLWCLRMVG